MRLIVGLLLLLAGPAFAQSVPPQGCTTTTCTGSPLPTGYLSVVGNQLQNSPGSDVRLACANFRGLPTDNMAPIRNAGFNCVTIGWRDAYIGSVATTWNPADLAGGVVLSNNNQTATGPSGGLGGVRATSSKSSGKACWQTTMSTIGTDTGVGVANSSFALATAGAGDTNSIALYAGKASPSAQIAFFNFVQLTVGTNPSVGGDAITQCADFDAKLFWATDTQMRTDSGAGAWNNSGTCNPTVAACGLSFSAMTGPYFPVYSDRAAGVVVLNTAGPLAVTLPTGFAFWDAAVTPPAGCNSLTQMVGCVASAQAAGLDVVFTHLGNEIPASGSACVGRQQNGLWFDQGGSSGNDDGCGDGHNWTYAGFKANTIKLLQRFNGNPTVIGYELHSEPLVNGAFTGTGGGGGGGGTGTFTVTGGQIIGPDGNPYHAFGVNITDDETANASLADIQRLFPKLNTIRLAVGADCGPPSGYACGQPIATIENWVNTITPAHIVVMIESHSCNGGNLNANQLDAGALFTFYNTLAVFFKNNPYVWFEDVNECGTAGATAENQNMYNAVRGAGNNTIVAFEESIYAPFGTPDGPASAYNSMSNIIWTPHAYNPNTGGTNDQTTANNDLAAAVQADAAYTTQAGGTKIPSLFSEVGFIDYFHQQPGNATATCSGGPTLANSFNCGTGQVVTAALSPAATGAIGGLIWLWYYPPCCGDQTDLVDRTTNPLTYFDSYGTTVESLINANSLGPVAPGGPVTAGNPPINWGGGGDTDIRLACSDVGAAVNAVNPGVIEFCPGPLNNATALLSGAAKP